MKFSPSVFTLLAVKSTDATRGLLPSDENDVSPASTTNETLNMAQTAMANSTNFISCWDGLSPTDRFACENNDGIMTPSCPQSQICKRVGDTCGYVCENPYDTAEPCGSDGQIVWNLLLNPVSGDNPTENLKECEFVEKIIDESKFGFTCDNINGKHGFINLPNIPKSQDYADFDTREIKILQADRYNDYVEAMDVSLHGLFQDSACDGLAANQTGNQIAFSGVFENNSCMTQSTTVQEDGQVWDIKQVVIGYDDLVYTTVSGNDIILQHGQSWTFECRYDIGGQGSLISEVKGKPDLGEPYIGHDELLFSMIFNNETIERPVIDISPNSPLIEPFYIDISMEKYGSSWLHLQQCKLIGEDGGFEEVIVENGCSTDPFLYQVQGGHNDRVDPLMETLEITPFKPLNATNTSYIWNVKCNFIACDDIDDESCKLADACAGRYDTLKSSQDGQGRKRRSGDGKTSHPITVEKTVEHPCAYASNTTSFCDGNGENCWTENVCRRTYNSSAVSDLSSALVIMSLLIK